MDGIAFYVYEINKNGYDPFKSKWNQISTGTILYVVSKETRKFNTYVSKTL